jgi:hypothetical protein
VITISLRTFSLLLSLPVLTFVVGFMINFNWSNLESKKSRRKHQEQIRSRIEEVIASGR